MIVRPKYHNVLDAMENIELTHVSALQNDVQHAHDIEQLRSEGLSYQDALTKLKEPGMAGNLRKQNYSTHPQSRRNFSTNSQSLRNSNNEASSSLTLGYRDALGKKTVHQKVQLQAFNCKQLPHKLPQ